MSQIVTTEFGRMNHVSVGNGETRWIWECPKCGTWGGLSDEQYAGRVSVVCGGPNDRGGCDYHETHDYGLALAIRMQARMLMGESPLDPEAPPNREER